MHEGDKISGQALRNGEQHSWTVIENYALNVIEMIKQNKKKYFRHMHNNPRKVWSELTSVIPKINKI